MTIKLFASLKALAGTDEVTVEVAGGATVADALAQLDWIDDHTPMVVAVNREYADRSTAIHPGDEIALIPPVSGGSGRPGQAPTDRAVTVRITDTDIDERAVSAAVRDPRAGAIVIFVGVTREVPALEYEAYAEMANAEIRALAVAAADRHGLCRISVAHRTGTVRLSEASVVIAASAPHRAEAFAGAREVIDEIKRRAPIWKKQEGDWVAGHLPGS